MLKHAPGDDIAITSVRYGNSLQDVNLQRRNQVLYKIVFQKPSKVTFTIIWTLLLKVELNPLMVHRLWSCFWTSFRPQVECGKLGSLGFICTKRINCLFVMLIQCLLFTVQILLPLWSQWLALTLYQIEISVSVSLPGIWPQQLSCISAKKLSNALHLTSNIDWKKERNQYLSVRSFKVVVEV